MQKAKNEKGLLVGCVLAAVLLAVGGIASVTHLSHVDHVLWVLQHPAPGIFVEALLIGVDAVLAVVFFLMVKRSSSATARKVVAVLAIVMGPHLHVFVWLFVHDGLAAGVEHRYASAGLLGHCHTGR